MPSQTPDNYNVTFRVLLPVDLWGWNSHDDKCTLHICFESQKQEEWNNRKFCLSETW